MMKRRLVSRRRSISTRSTRRVRRSTTSSATGASIDAEHVMSNNFAFGGINTSLIFRRVR